MKHTNMDVLYIIFVKADSQRYKMCGLKCSKSKCGAHIYYFIYYGRRIDPSRHIDVIPASKGLTDSKQYGESLRHMLPRW